MDCITDVDILRAKLTENQLISHQYQLIGLENCKSVFVKSIFIRTHLFQIKINKANCKEATTTNKQKMIANFVQKRQNRKYFSLKDRNEKKKRKNKNKCVFNGVVE